MGAVPASREKAIEQAIDAGLQVVWLTGAQAVASLWESPDAHKKFAKPWLALIKEEASAAKAAIERSAIAAELAQTRSADLAKSSSPKTPKRI